jgi:hypothetical protein
MVGGGWELIGGLEWCEFLPLLLFKFIPYSPILSRF